MITYLLHFSPLAHTGIRFRIEVKFREGGLPSPFLCIHKRKHALGLSTPDQLYHRLSLISFHGRVFGVQRRAGVALKIAVSVVMNGKAFALLSLPQR